MCTEFVLETTCIGYVPPMKSLNQVSESNSAVSLLPSWVWSWAHLADEQFGEWIDGMLAYMLRGLPLFDYFEGALHCKMHEGAIDADRDSSSKGDQRPTACIHDPSMALHLASSLQLQLHARGGTRRKAAKIAQDKLARLGPHHWYERQCATGLHSFITFLGLLVFVDLDRRCRLFPLLKNKTTDTILIFINTIKSTLKSNLKLKFKIWLQWIR